MKRATGFAAVLMVAAMVFTMAGCGSSKDADTSAKKRQRQRILRIRKIPISSLSLDLMQNILHMDIKMTMANM